MSAVDRATTDMIAFEECRQPSRNANSRLAKATSWLVLLTYKYIIYNQKK